MFIHWPEIEGFHQVRKSLELYPELARGRSKVTYRGKVKLHGTNAAIGFGHTGHVWAQSRERVITPGDDNMGFAAWAEKAVEAAKTDFLRTITDDLRDVVIFGEWCGPGVMRGTAINQAPKRIFAVFAASAIANGEPTDTLIVEPDDLNMLAAALPDTHVLPWDGEPFEMDVLAPAEELAVSLDAVNARVLEVEQEDPWVKKVFGASGIGEGVVYYPLHHHAGRENFKNLAFKAKGEAHKNVARAKPAQVDPAVAAGASDFAGMVLTPARLEQGARSAAGGEFRCEMRLIGPYLAWVLKDVQKECETELEASKLTWKQVQKAVSDRARDWYIEQAKRL